MYGVVVVWHTPCFEPDPITLDYDPIGGDPAEFGCDNEHRWTGEMTWTLDDPSCSGPIELCSRDLAICCYNGRYNLWLDDQIIGYVADPATFSCDPFYAEFEVGCELAGGRLAFSTVPP